MKKKKIKISVAACLLSLVVGVCGGFVLNDFLTEKGLVAVSGFSHSQMRVLAQASKLIDNKAYGGYDNDEALAYALKGMAASLDDDYACYYTKEEMQAYTDSNEGNISGGIGISIAKKTDGIVIAAVYKGLSAEEAGIKAGDYLVAVDGTPVSEMEFSEIDEKVHGETGTTVEITVKRNGENRNFLIARCDGQRQMTEYSMLDGTDILYIKIISFHSNAAEYFEKAIEYGEENGYNGIIIDLRENYGGEVSLFEKIADIMLPEGETFYAMNNKGKKIQVCKSDAAYIDKPTCVLINACSASASEALAGSLRDMGGATLIGTKSYGKGIMQSSYTLSNGGVFKLTVAKYYLPSGVCIHGEGLTPDIEVELSDELTSDYWLRTRENDLQLQAAIQKLS